jgi:hypothetical protein
MGAGAMLKERSGSNHASVAPGLFREPSVTLSPRGALDQAVRDAINISRQGRERREVHHELPDVGPRGAACEI